MKTETQAEDGQLNGQLTATNILPLTVVPAEKRKAAPALAEAQFKVKEFENASGTTSYRVEGYRRDGTRFRQNFADLNAAKAKQIELETEYLQGHRETGVLATTLSENQARIAEAAFLRLQADEEMLLAIDEWIRRGKNATLQESATLDEAFKKFKEYVDSSTLRHRSKKNLKSRVNLFVNSVPNLKVSAVTPDTIEAFLAKRSGVSAKTKDNDRRAVSAFFSWCIQRPRRWATTNPCREVRIKKDEAKPPTVLSIEQCEQLLKAAESHTSGRHKKQQKARLVPYFAVCIFGGLRPFEAARLTWDKVNLKDREIRLEATMTKTKRPRVVTICDTLAAWLEAYEGKPFYPSNWRRDFEAVQAAAGFNEKNPWPDDVMRHTAISHFFRQCGSYGRTAEQFGNSEAIIKAHYQGRVTSEETERFYALTPRALRAKKGGRK